MRGRGNQQTLRRHHTTVPQRIVHELEIRLLEETLGRPLGITAIGNDDVEFAAAVGEEFEAVADVRRYFRVAVAGGHGGEVFFGEADDSLGLLAFVCVDEREGV